MKFTNDLPEIMSAFTTSAPRPDNDYSEPELTLLAAKRKSLFWIAMATLFVAFCPTPLSWWPFIGGIWFTMHVAGIATCIHLRVMPRLSRTTASASSFVRKLVCLRVPGTIRPGCPWAQ
jgi:hypothetical protein